MRLLATKHLSLVGAAIVCMVLGAQLNVSAKAQSRTYPERGIVIDSYAHPRSVYVGSSTRKVTPIFRVETDAEVYEIENKRNSLALGEKIEFRVEKDVVYVKNRDKEEKFHLVGTEPKRPQRYK